MSGQTDKITCDVCGAEHLPKHLSTHQKTKKCKSHREDYVPEIRKVNITFTILKGTQQIRYNFCHKGKKYTSSYISYKNKDIDEVKARLTEKFKIRCQELGIMTVFD